MQNVKEQYEKAVLQIKLAGVVVFENDMSCCRSCASYAMSQNGVTEETNVAWTYGGQGTELVWEHGQPMYAPEVEDDEDDDEGGHWSAPSRPQPAKEQFWYHSGPDGARVAAEKFREAGFTVEWDGTAHTAVLVKLAD